MSARLKVGGVDLSEYLRLQPEDGTDPVPPGWRRPQFSGAPALSEGLSWVSDATDNRVMPYMLYLTGATRAAIKQQISEVEAVLVKGAQVEWCIDPSIEESTFFDLERGILEEDFNYYHQINAVQAVSLTLVCRPYGNTATHRLIASIPAATSAVVKFAATGVLGDTGALANFEVRVGSQVASAGRVVMWGVHPHPSHNAYRPATSSFAQPGATVIGASGAVGSQYTAIPVSPTSASGIAYSQVIDPPDAHIGRHRVVAFGRSGLTVPISLYAEDRFGAVLGATAQATQIDPSKWQVIDLGEINVQGVASGQNAVPTQTVNIVAGGASGAVINASPAFHLDGIMLLPLDYSAGILRTPGSGGNSLLYQDGFTRIESSNALLTSQPNAEAGGIWSKFSGVLGFGAVNLIIKRAIAVAAEQPGGGPNLSAPNASAAMCLASGALNTNVFGSLKLAVINAQFVESPSLLCASAAITFWPKARTNASIVAGGVGAKFQFGPSQMLQIVSASANGATAVLASAGIASTLASGIYKSQTHTLSVQINGPRIDVWLATGALGASPVLSASAVDALVPGWVAVTMNNGGNVGASGVVFADDLQVQSLAGGASDIGARETFRFESHPQKRVYQGNASVYQQDRLVSYRGIAPKIPPVGSAAAATGPARVVVFQGEVDNVQGLDGPDIALTVLERYRFLR